ncbi:MAG TPA: PTS sugar transporter subunit IIA [bacterium]|nr:PTS sugar transporter subunit IIA [bacterium]
MAEGSHALSALLPRSAIRVGVEAADWRAAVTAAGEALASSGATTPAYTGEMIAAIEAMGPYMVIAPGIALPHARPSPAVLRVGLSVVALARPVPFGHPQNDPVTLVIALAATDNRSHTQALATLAGLLAEETRRAALLRAERPEEILAAVEAYEDRS